MQNTNKVVYVPERTKDILFRKKPATARIIGYNNNNKWYS